MNFKLTGLVVAACLVATGCATKTPEPALATQLPTVKNYDPPLPPPEPVVQIPSWYVSPPAMTAQSIFTAGTATSNNLSMATQKAMLDADTKLAFQMESSIKAMLKSYQVDMTNDSVEHTELVAKKMAAIVINGHVQSDMQIVQEGKRFRVFILMRYPLEGLNYFGDKVRTSAAAAKARKDSERAHAELDQQQDTVASEEPTQENVLTKATDNKQPVAQSTVTPVVASTPKSVPVVDADPITVVPANNASAAAKLKSEIDAVLAGTQ
ncbi:hypothetical protein UFOVP116_147 [uncultured Caudovirales phage]|uniref:LPP20 lipoprotein n=1 Tax=uncultured Caudovirales phage TaxID=2100421 RepID=A0A6J5L6X5_9CAUD|nr:hypothetical protein UFOVP116_147 [uncultured Caudovirales phage]